MLKFKICIAVVFSALLSFSQQYGNEWINVSQQYYKFEITANGIYRLDKTSLEKSGVPLSTINPKNIQIFGRGVEIPIYIEGETDGKFDANDFIEFYAQKNDSWLDSIYYEGAENVTNPYSSVIGNDTANYYLTWNTSTTNNRYTNQSDFNFTGLTNYNHIKVENVYDYGIDYSYGPTYAEKGFAAGFQKGEGRTDDVTGSKKKNKTIQLNRGISKSLYNYGTNGQDAEVEVRLWHFSNAIQNPDHHVNFVISANGSLVTLSDTIFEGVHLIDHKFSVKNGDFTSNRISLFTRKINDLGAAADNSVLVYSKIKYNRTLDLDGRELLKFRINTSSEHKKIAFSNLKALNTAVVYSPSTKLRFPLQKSGNSFSTKISNNSEDNIYLLGTDSSTTSIADLTKVTFIDYKAAVKDHDYIIITHKSLLVEAQQYNDYRKLTGFNPVIVDIEQLYNQFGYGVKYNPLSITNFMNFAYTDWTIKPAYLLLLGKGVSANYGTTNNLVPTFGVPGSDQMLVSGINNTKFESPIAIGRVSALAPQDVTTYLNKVKDFESLPYEEWMKRALHFSGGNTASQQTIFRSYVDTYGSIYEKSLYGGIVLSQSKASSSPFDISLQDSIKSIIKTGVTLMTFFGHSGNGGFDVSVDRIENWGNEKGKYPFMLANSCFSGNIFTQHFKGSTSEKYLFEPDKGVIGYYAHTGAGYSYPLFLFTKNFYDELTNSSYGKTLGNVIQKNIFNSQKNLSSEFYRSTYYNSAYHGDPAIKLNIAQKPDVVVEQSSIYFEPKNVTTELQNFKANVILKNIGRSIATPVTIRLVRKYEKEKPQPKSDTIYSISLPNLSYKDTVSFLLDIDPLNGDGTNRFEVVIDPLSEIDELDENNNSISTNLVINSGVITPVYPYEYQIVPNNNVVLRGVTNDPFLGLKTYVVQVSTDPNFNLASLLKNESIIDSGGVIELPLTDLIDSKVYYWRVTSNVTDESLWRYSSFQYIKDQNGWGQADSGQFTRDAVTFLEHSGSEFNFKQNTKTVYVHSGDVSALNTGFYIDGAIGETGPCASTTYIMVGVIDGKTLKPWESAYFPRNDGTCDENKPNHFNCDRVKYNNLNIAGCGLKIPPFNDFVFGNGDSKGVVNLIKDVPKGNYVVMWGYKNVKWRNFDTNDINYFVDTLGAKTWTIPDTVHGANIYNGYALFAKIGDTTKTVEAIQDTGTGLVDLYAKMTSEFPFGEITSTIIGPAKSWKNFQWKYSGNSNDSVNFDVIGIKSDGTEKTLFSNISKGASDSIDISSINATTYPNLKLNMFLQDNIDFTAPQLREWHVYHTGIGDATINPKKGFITSKDTLGEGELFEFSVAVENISDYDMDSLLVSFYIEDANRVLHQIPNIKTKPLKAGDTTMVSVSYATNGLRGVNKLWMEINPNKAQPERYQFNNYATHSFYVSEDSENPILDVTVDGIHLLNGDLISAKPHFLIKLSDEHPNLALNDTSLLQLYLSKNGGEAQQIFFSNGSDYTIDYTPAVLPDNSFKINYYPTLTDGDYVLTIKAIDRSKNKAGDIDYRVNFIIESKPSITKVLNWPNPFTTRTKFVFTLTGSKVPTEFKIQILNVSGVVVKEITKQEIGNIRIGRNISEYAWDGTDTFGDRLGNGVYFYKVFTNLNGSQIENRASEADQFFTKGFGKMYLMR